MNLTKIKKIVFLCILILQCSIAKAQEFSITGNWKVSWDDDKEFRNANFNDADWKVLPTLKWTDDDKKTANRVLWVRHKVVIPSSLMRELSKTGLLTLSMGKISQSDDTYLNGKLIGSTGSGDSYRNYLVKKEDILWDQPNTISIRVRHWGSFQVSKQPAFIAATPAHFLSYDSGIKSGDANAPVNNKELIYELAVNSRSPQTMEGIVKADFFDFAGQKISSIEKKLTVAPGKNIAAFPYTSTAPFLKIVFTFSSGDHQYKQEWNAMFGYQNLVYKKPVPVANYKAPQKYVPAAMNQQVVGGWIGDRLKANMEKRLYKVDEEALLAGFINRPGNHSWIGEHIGKFLEAACNTYDNTEDPALKIQIDRSAQQLIAAQLADGYLGTYEMDSHWTSWDVWSHRYDLVGLLRYYELSGFNPALGSCKKIGDLLIKTFGSGEGQRDIIKAGGHVGMAATCILESMAELYRFTGEKKYLDFCYFIIRSFDSPNGPRIITTLNEAGRVDKVANAKAYEMLSNMLGILKLYRLTNDDRFLKPMLTAWNDISKNRLYITGTASSFEHFQDDQLLPAEKNSNMGEGCVTTSWVQFNYQLLCITGDIKYLDELERSVYNHLTGAENPQTGCVSYYTPLAGVKPYGCSITCCMSSVPRAIAMIPLFVNGKINDRPSFLFYQPGLFATTIGRAVPVSFTTTNDFLTDGNVWINVDKTVNTAYTIDFRNPYWCASFTIAINGKKQPVGNAAVVAITRVWKKGDKVSISFTMPTLVLEGGKSYPGKIAFQRGPQVLAFDSSINSVNLAELSVNTDHIQILHAEKSLPSQWIGQELFQLKTTAGKDSIKIWLVPYADASQTGGAISTWINKSSK